MGLRDGSVAATPLADVATRRKSLDPSLLALAEVLAQ
jgi:hypothetical protein